MGASGLVRKFVLFLVGMAASGLVLSQPLPAQAQSGSYIKAGLLTCTVNPGIGFIIASSRSLSCTFSPTSRSPEFYSGRISRVGVDIGITGATVIVWVVLSKTTGYPRGALAGTYGGLSAEATMGLGLGANVLVGGSNRAFALQPLSVQGQVGLSFAIGVTRLTLTAD